MSYKRNKHKNNRAYRHYNHGYSGNSYKPHASLGKQFLRALLGLFLSIGFGLFWVAIVCGITEHIFFFIVGILALLMGLIVFVATIAKQSKR